MPVLSAVATVLGDHAIIAVALNVARDSGTEMLDAHEAHPVAAVHRLWLGRFHRRRADRGVIARPSAANQVTQFTWFVPLPKGLLNSYGFFAMVIFGAIYYIVPQLVGQEFPSANSCARISGRCGGRLLFVVPLAVGGIVQGLKLQHADIPFTDIAKGTLPFSAGEHHG